MMFHTRLQRPGRLLDWLVIALFGFIFAGLALYHYRRLERIQEDPTQLRELAKQALPEDRTPRFDWPQWRGPNRDGVSTETDILTHWPAQGPPILWQEPIGEGYASVAVVKGRLFTIFLEAGQETVICRNAETGKEHWRFSYPCDYRNQYGNGPRATPTVAGEHVYTVGVTGIMHCLQAFTDAKQGELVWRKDLSDDFKARVPEWGFAFSPLVESDLVYIQPGGADGNSLAALDPVSGDIVWKKHDDPASYSSPIAATFHDTRQILFFTGTRLVSVEPRTGKQLWDYPWPTDAQCNIATPIVVQDYVFISSGYQRGCAVLHIHKSAETWQAKLVYHNRRMRNHFSSSVRHHEHIYGFDDSNLTCMNFRTGAVKWKERGFDKGSVLLVNDQLIIYGENGTLALAEANPTKYVEKSRFQFTTARGPCWSVPVLANGRFYVRDSQKLVCFDMRTEAN